MLRYSFWGEAYGLWMFMGSMEPILAGAPSAYGAPLEHICEKKVSKAACQGGPLVRFMGI